MKTRFGLFCCVLFLSSCFVKKKTTYSQEKQVTVVASPTTEKTEEEPEIVVPKKTSRKKADKIISTALGYAGVKYKYGGTTKKGMDCSGLLYVSFNEHNKTIPRNSRAMANTGSKVALKKVNKGDLLFFHTGRGRKKDVNHVGMVVSVKGKDIKFIHATSSRGVIVSSLKEGYWGAAFIKAKRML